MNWYYTYREIKRSVNICDLYHNLVYRVTKKKQPFPVPNSYLRVLAIASANVQWYLEYGERTADAILSILEKHSIDYPGFKRVLDFGCGSGRIIRHMYQRLKARLTGADYNKKVITWCRKHLEFGDFFCNDPLPPLPLKDGMIDFIYCLSVFTHFPADAESLWLREMGRIMKPGGYFLLTLRGKGYYNKLSDEEKKLFDRGELVVRNPSLRGRNECDSYHPGNYVEQKYTQHFTLIDYIESPKEFAPHDLAKRNDPGQDVLLLKAKT